MTQRTVFFVSDGTGITAETFGNPSWPSSHSSLGMCGALHRQHREGTASGRGNQRHPARGRPAAHRLCHAVNAEVLDVFKRHCQARVLDMISSFIEPLEDEFGVTSNHRVGRFSNVTQSREYHDRIEAINFALAHDDGQSA